MLLETGAVLRRRAAAASGAVGRSYRGQKAGEALQRLDEALAKEPNNGEALLMKADLLRLQQPRQAAPFYERVTESNPSCLRAWIGLAETLLSADQATNAVQAIIRHGP